MCREQSWHFATWNIDQGLQVGGETSSEANDPLAAVKAAGAFGGDQTSILVLENFHRFLTSVEIVQALVGQIHAGKQTRSIIVVLAPVLDLPPELEKLFVVIEHELPTREQLQEIAEGIGTEEGELANWRGTRKSPRCGRRSDPRGSRIGLFACRWFDMAASNPKRSGS